MAHRCGQGADALIDRRGHGEQPRPRHVRVRRQAQPFVSLGRPDQRAKIAAVDRERARQAVALAVVVAEQPLRLGEVEPQRQAPRIERRRAREQRRRRRRIAGVQPLQPRAVQRLRRAARRVPSRHRRQRTRCAVTARIAATRMK